MHTPRGLFLMKYFFHSGIDSDTGEDISSLTVKKKIQSYIEAEDPRKPLSDSKIMKILRSEVLLPQRHRLRHRRGHLQPDGEEEDPELHRGRGSAQTAERFQDHEDPQ